VMEAVFPVGEGRPLAEEGCCQNRVAEPKAQRQRCDLTVVSLSSVVDKRATLAASFRSLATRAATFSKLMGHAMAAMTAPQPRRVRACGRSRRPQNSSPKWLL
jgi:hypothetical protein